MATLKLDAVQTVRVIDSYSALAKVLDEVKRRSLQDHALVAMHELEAAVQHLESFQMLIRV